MQQAAGSGGGGDEVERVENGPDRGLSLLETEDCLAGYSELREGEGGGGGVRGWLNILIALSRCFSLFFLFSRPPPIPREGRGTREMVHAVFLIERHEIMDESIAICCELWGWRTEAVG